MLYLLTNTIKWLSIFYRFPLLENKSLLDGYLPLIIMHEQTSILMLQLLKYNWWNWLVLSYRVGFNEWEDVWLHSWFLSNINDHVFGIKESSGNEEAWHKWLQMLFLFSRSVMCLCDPVNCGMPGFPVLHYLLEFAQTHVHWVSDAILQSQPLLSPSPLVLNLSQYQGLSPWVGRCGDFQTDHE